MPSMQPGQPMNSPFARMGNPHAGKPAEPKENGPMSPASSLGKLILTLKLTNNLFILISLKTAERREAKLRVKNQI
jgi:hypothetical protein